MCNHSIVLLTCLLNNCFFKKILIIANRNLIRGDIIEFEEFKLYDNDRYDGVNTELKLVFDQKVRNKGKKYVINDGDLIDFKYKKK